MVYAPTREDLIEPGSPIWELRRISPVIREDASDLRDVLLRALRDYPFAEMDGVAARLNSCPGDAARRIREETYALLGL